MQMFDIFFHCFNELCLIFLDSTTNLFIDEQEVIGPIQSLNTPWAAQKGR